MPYAKRPRSTPAELAAHEAAVDDYITHAAPLRHAVRQAAGLAEWPLHGELRRREVRYIEHHGMTVRQTVEVYGLK